MKVTDLIQYLTGVDGDLDVRLEDEDGETFDATIVLNAKNFKSSENYLIIK